MEKSEFEKLDNAAKCAAWNAMTHAQRDRCRDTSGMTRELIGLEGMRVEVADYMTGEKRRFIVGRSTGWRPCHIEISRRTALGGTAAPREYNGHTYASVRPLYRVWERGDAWNYT